MNGEYASSDEAKRLMRADILRRTVVRGPAWETSSNMRLAMNCAMKSKRKKAPSRLGAMQLNSFERVESKGETLSPTEATAFCALNARRNYLALDKPDIAYAAKELRPPHLLVRPNWHRSALTHIESFNSRVLRTHSRCHDRTCHGCP